MRRRKRPGPPRWAIAAWGLVPTAGLAVLVGRRAAARAKLQGAAAAVRDRIRPANSDAAGGAEAEEAAQDDAAAHGGEITPTTEAGQPAGVVANEAPDDTGEEASGEEVSGEAASGRQPWQCDCGQDYLVAGQDRHQIYWLADADENDPLLSDHCPSCDRPLPAVSRANADD